MELTEFSLRIALATLAGLVIGAERELQRKNAGLRTNALVALGSCIFVLLSLNFKDVAYVDITRVLGQVATGIGFIGAGTILQHGKSVKGLTTAATLWCSAGAGCLAAYGFKKELLIVSVLILVINYGFNFLEHKLKLKREQRNGPDKRRL